MESCVPAVLPLTSAVCGGRIAGNVNLYVSQDEPIETALLLTLVAHRCIRSDALFLVLTAQSGHRKTHPISLAYCETL